MPTGSHASYSLVFIGVQWYWLVFASQRHADGAGGGSDFAGSSEQKKSVGAARQRVAEEEIKKTNARRSFLAVTLRGIEPRFYP